MLPVPSIVSYSAGRLRKVATAALLGTTILTGAVGFRPTLSRHPRRSPRNCPAASPIWSSA